MIAINDFKDNSDDRVRDYLVRIFEAPRERVDEFDILVAELNNHGHEEDAFFLLRRRSDGALFEVHASHCSCYGFEGQFMPEPTTREYLRSDKFTTSRSERIDAVRLALLNIHEGD